MRFPGVPRIKSSILLTIRIHQIWWRVTGLPTTLDAFNAIPRRGHLLVIGVVLLVVWCGCLSKSPNAYHIPGIYGSMAGRRVDTKALESNFLPDDDKEIFRYYNSRQ
jgi:hypothetical protein